jgi:hypothetical protein
LPNAGLVNSSVTVGSTAISLGGTATTVAGLTSLATNTLTSASATALTLQSAGTTAVTIDTSQNVAVGTTTAQITSAGRGNITLNGSSSAIINLSVGDVNKGQFYHGGTDMFLGNQANGYLAFQSNATERMRITSAGNVGIGMTSPTRLLDVQSASTGAVNIASFATSGAGGQGMLLGIDTTNSITTIKNNTSSSYGMAFYSGGGGSESMRIDSSGNLLVSGTNNSQTAGVGIKLLAESTSPTIDIVLNTPNNNTPYILYNTNATYNGYRWYVKVDGGIANFSGNNINLSDERTKTNIELSGNYLSKICAIPVKLFNYKDEQENEQRTLGVIAQDVETSAPELVNNEGFGETPEDGIPLKSIYTTDMMFALMKSIQELKAINDTQAETLTQQTEAINALTARVVALEAK